MLSIRACLGFTVLLLALVLSWILAPGHGQIGLPAGCIYNSSLPTVTSGSSVALQCDANGKILTH